MICAGEFIVNGEMNAGSSPSLSLTSQIESRLSVSNTVTVITMNSVWFMEPHCDDTINCTEDFYAVFAPSA